MNRSVPPRTRYARNPALWLALIGLACATSPTGRNQLRLFSENDMNRLGAQSFAQIKEQQTVSTNAEVNAYVQCIANALSQGLAPEWQSGWEVVVFEADSANAFALPGRRIGVHTGLVELAETPDQLAAVMGHEISHVQAHHGNERMSQQFAAQLGMAVAVASTDSNTPGGRATLAALGLGTQFGVLLPFSRTHESEADLLGLELMSRSGFAPGASVELWQNMAAAGGGQPPEWMSTHPSHRTRIKDLKAALPAAKSLADASRANGKKPECPKPPPAEPSKPNPAGH